MKRFLALIVFAVIFVSIQSQTFTASIGMRDMCGVPGDVFSKTISFTNTSGSPISLFLDRYSKNLPPYWNSCYCYIQCHSPLRDTLTIGIQPFATVYVTIQFKTDSVNPGNSLSKFKYYQYGFQNNVDSFQLVASTACTTGLNKIAGTGSHFKAYPNPATDHITVTVSNELIRSIKVYDILGRLKTSLTSENSPTQTLNIKDYEKGVYFMELFTDKSKYCHRILKE